MFPYLIAFAAASALFEIGQAEEGNRNSHLLSWLCYGVALFILCGFAGARDPGIGSDSASYGVFLYKQGLIANDFSSFYSVVDSSIWDVAPLFALGSFAVIKLFGSQFAFFFIVQLGAILPVFLVARKSCRRALGLVMLLYLLAFYSLSLNAMRQCIAVGFVLLALTRLFDCKFIQVAIFELTAIGMHYSAIIGLFFIAAWFAIFKMDGVGDWT